jgi:hypothetical protein
MTHIRRDSPFIAPNNGTFTKTYLPPGVSGQEDVKKSIWLSFRDFSFDPKCMPRPQLSLIGHPGAIFLAPNSLRIFKSIFSHPPDEITPNVCGGLADPA